VAINLLLTLKWMLSRTPLTLSIQLLQ
jgi:hypothetical protein